MKHKCINLLKPLVTIDQKKYWSFYPSELFTFDHFTLIHPVHMYLFSILSTLVSRTGVRLGDPEAGPPTSRGRGRSGLTFSGLGVPQGGAPKALEKAGRVGLSYDQTVTRINFQLQIFSYFFVVQTKEEKEKSRRL